MELMERDTTEKRLDDLGVKVDHRFDLVDHRFAQVDQRFDAVDQRFAQVDQRFVQVDQRFDAVEQRLDGVEGQVRELRRDMKAGFDSVNERFDALHRLMIQFSGGLLGTVIVASAGLIATQL